MNSITSEHKPDTTTNDLTEKISHVVLFDGICNLCSSGVQFILKHEKEPLLKFAAIQSESGQKLLTRYNIDPSVTDSIIYIENNMAYIRSTAGLKIASHLRMPWRAASWFSFLPAVLRDGIYDLIARHRYKFFGKKDECWLPDAAWKDRFI